MSIELENSELIRPRKVKAQIKSCYETVNLSADSLKALSDKWAKYRDNEGLGSRDLEVDIIAYDLSNLPIKPAAVANISYNGRVWAI